MRSASLAPGPAKRAEFTPGAPPRASTSRPESSARVSRPLAAARVVALRTAFSSKVAPVSATPAVMPASAGVIIR